MNDWTVKETEEVLISRFQDGDRSSFDRLMALHTNRVYAVSWGVLHNREEALDAVQEVFVKLYKALPKFNPQDNLGAWIYRVCLNHCIDRRRRAKKPVCEMTEEDWDKLSGAKENEPEFRAYQSETGRIIKEAVDCLPKRQRMVFILRHYNYMSINEIAVVLGCSVGAVKAHLSRATAKLRNNLHEPLGRIPLEVNSDEL